VRWINGSMD